MTDRALASWKEDRIMTQRTPSIVAVQVLLTITALEFFGPIVARSRTRATC